MQFLNWRFRKDINLWRHEGRLQNSFSDKTILVKDRATLHKFSRKSTFDILQPLRSSNSKCSKNKISFGTREWKNSQVEEVFIIFIVFITFGTHFNRTLRKTKPAKTLKQIISCTRKEDEVCATFKI